MPTPEEVRSHLTKVTVIDDHAEVLEQAVNALEELKDPALIDDVLAVFERCEGQDDYGMFSSLETWMEKLPRAEVAPKLRASLLRHPTWKVIEMLPGFIPRAETIALFEQVVREGTFRDHRYDASWVQKTIDELKAG